jgi:formylglycine-generating enzyme required for sulfatase activity
MADQHRTYRVFISSTYLDNVVRRKVVLEAIERAGPGRMVAVRMERFTADERPTVEVCQARAVECDVLVGIIAHRYGWEPEGQPPGEEKSITWLEYEAARSAGRPCLMFEIDPEVPTTRADRDPDNPWRKQEKLDRFKAQYAKDQLRTYFRDDATLGMAVQQALREWRERKEGRVSPPARTDDLEAEIGRYRAAATEEHRSIPLAGFGNRVRVPIHLEDLYVGLQATRDLRVQAEVSHPKSSHAAEMMERAGHAEQVALGDALRLAVGLGRKGLVILGDPGAGKTTHLKWLLLRCFEEGKGSEKLGLPAGLVPVFLPLRELKEPDRETLDDFIRRQLARNKQLKLGADFSERVGQERGWLLLLDGLDEVASAETRVKVAGWVEEALLAYDGKCWPVVTCRYAGYGEQGKGGPEVRLSSKFLELHIRPLEQEQREAFVRRWYLHVETGLVADGEAAKRKAEAGAADLLATLAASDARTTRMAEMVGNPLLLANLCLVHRDLGKLPKERWKLYHQCVEVLLERWRERRQLSLTVDEAKRAMQPVAAWMHEKEGRTRASGAELEPVLAPGLKAVRWEGGGAKELLEAVRDDAGLLTGWSAEQYGFMHLSFQEYLTARELRRQALEATEGRVALMEKLAGHYGESWWQEVLLLFVAMGNPSLFEPLMREVVKRPAFAEKRELLGMLMEEAAERRAGPFVSLLQQKPGRDEGLWKRQKAALEALRLMKATDELETLAGALGSHPSKEIREWAGGPSKSKTKVTEKGGVELVFIEGGEFLMGSPPDEEGRRDDETQHRVKVSPFWLARYPVTNEEYGRFLKENPHIKPPRFWGDRRFNQAQQPVVGLTWEDAAAFAKWTGGRLPTEAEWEYACRAGTTGPRYDDDLDAIAWWGKNSGGATHPVGQKKPNAWGLYDMLGNVWEWCADWYGEYPEEPVTDPPGPARGTRRVVRGGSWGNDNPSGVRGANRYWLEPWRSDDYLGSRCARGVDPP